jgi:hypothetical protein
LEKLGHFVKMGGRRRVKKVLEGKPGGRRKKGRSKGEWMLLNLTLGLWA